MTVYYNVMHLKFISLNIWEGGRLLNPLLDFLRQENADIIALQEVFNSADLTLDERYRSVSVFQQKLEYAYADFAPAFRDAQFPQFVERGNAVLSRFPLQSAANIFFDVPYDPNFYPAGPDFSHTPRNLQSLTAIINNQKLHILNVHGIWGVDGNDTDRRLKMADIIIEQMRDKGPCILVGDFNTDEKSQTIQNIGKHAINVFQGERGTSFNMNQKKGGGYGTAVVDFIFVSRDIKVLSHSMPLVDVSDHLPLVCEMEIAR